ncbi:MAG: glycosyltransferase family 39 protein, partial [Anaerolineales bacterium]|nr:glycosyltransferase family 39 protein [Anaerolineales bacterium]
MENRSTTSTSTPQHGRYWLLLLALITLMAFFLRLRHIDTTGLWSDQSFTLNTAMRWVNGGDMPLASNKSSVGFVNPPMIEYVYVLGLWLWHDILSVALVTMVSGLAAVVLTAYGTYKLFGPRAAVWSLLLFAVNPWSVVYSQLIWNQTMIPFFATLTFIPLLLYLFVEQKPWYLLLSFVSAGCMTQVHPASAPQVFTMGLLLLIFIRRVNIWTALTGGVLFVITYIPYIIYEYGVGWTDLYAIRQVAEQEATVSPASLLVSLDLLHAQGIPHQVGYVQTLDRLATIIFVVSVAAVLALFIQLFRKDPATIDPASGRAAVEQRYALIAILLWFLIPILFYLRSQEHLQIYYLINQFPTHFMLLGIGLGWLQTQSGRWLGTHYRATAAEWLITLPIVLLAVGQVAFSLHAQNVRVENPFNELQIRHVREGIHTAQTLTAERPECPLVVLSDGGKVETSTLSLFREFSQIDHVLLADADESLPLPPPCALYLDARPGSWASLWLDQQNPENLGKIDLQALEWQFRRLETAATVERFIEQGQRPEEQPVWVNGGALAAYDYGPLAAEQPFELELLWHIENQPDDKLYHVGTYLLDENQQVFLQADGAGFDSIQWQE